MITNLSKKQIFKAHDIKYGKLNGHRFESLRLNKSDYTLNFKLTNKQSPLKVLRAESLIQVCCNGGLFSTKTKEPLGQTIIDREIIISTKVESDNGTPISGIECYPLILTHDGNLTTHFLKDESCEELLKDGNLNSSLCGWGCLVYDYLPQELYKYEIVHQNPKRRQRIIIGQDKSENYVLYSFHKANYKEVKEFLVDQNLKFAYCLDEGHSTQIYSNGYQLTPKYCWKTGRPVATCITFTEC